MTSIFNGIAAIFEIMFSFMQKVADISNLFIIIGIALAVFFWITYMIKVEKGGDNYLSK